MKIEDMIGKTYTKVEGEEGDESMVFLEKDGHGCQFIHHQDCCESVSIEDINGDINDLMNTPILEAYESENEPEPESNNGEYEEWTFYRFVTIKGTVVVRWYGTSNGYYSTNVSFEAINR